MSFYYEVAMASLKAGFCDPYTDTDCLCSLSVFQIKFVHLVISNKLPFWNEHTITMDISQMTTK